MGNSNAKLKFLSGQYAGAEIELTPFTELIMGRNPDLANFVFESEGISRKHCIIQYNQNDQRFRVTDLSSSGTYINGIRKIAKGTTEYISSGDTLKIGHSDNVVQLIAADADEYGKTGKLSSSGRNGVHLPGQTGAAKVTQPYQTPGYTGPAAWSDKSNNGSGADTDVLGIVAFCLNVVSCLASVIMLLCACGGVFGYGGFAAGSIAMCVAYSWIMWVIAIFGLIGVVLGCVYLSQTKDATDRPRWLGGWSVACGVTAAMLMIIIYVTAASTLSSASDKINSLF